MKGFTILTVYQIHTGFAPIYNIAHNLSDSHFKVIFHCHGASQNLIIISVLVFLLCLLSWYFRMLLSFYFVRTIQIYVSYSPLFKKIYILYSMSITLSRNKFFLVSSKLTITKKKVLCYAIVTLFTSLAPIPCSSL